MLFVTSESLGPAHIQGEGARKSGGRDHWGPFYRLPTIGSEQILQLKDHYIEHSHVESKKW